MSKPYRYVAYGLQIESELELPELGSSVDAANEADLTIRLGEIPRFGHEDGGHRNGMRWLDPQTFWLHVDDVAHYRVSEARAISVMPEPGAQPSEVRAYLLGSVCGALLVQRRFLVLHGNAIRVGNGCLVCVGDSGAGKSTLAAGFLKRGFQILADDVVAVDADGRAIPGFPRIKLWQDAADQLGFATGELMRVFPGMDKFNLPIEPFDPDLRLPIRWIYQLTQGDVEDICIEPITGLRRFRMLRDNTYRNEYLDGPEMLSQHLKQCSRLAGQVRLSQVVRPSRGFSLDRLIDRLLKDAASTKDTAETR